MSVRGAGRLRRIKKLFQSRAIILTYHRIAELDPDPQLLCVTPTHFAEHLEHLRQQYRPISLQALRSGLVIGKVPRKAVVVTLDDGYGDNLWNAQPLLERYDVPATVFAATGYVNHDREFPSDVMERCLLQRRALADSLTLQIEGEIHSWQMGDSSGNASAWNVTVDYDPTPRHRCYRELHSLFRPLSDASRQAVLQDLANWASCSTDVRSDRRALSSDELRTLSEDGLVEVGAHTANHLVLAAQPANVQREEINESKRYLQDILGRPVTSFSYPYGGPSDVSRQTIGLVKEAGFNLACASVPGPTTKRSDLFRLPRVWVRDWDRQEFAEQLRRAFDG